MMMFDQRELHFAWIVGLADGPFAAAHFRSTILNYDQKNAGRENQVSEGSAHSHKSLQFRRFRGPP
jgi:hypothetical protein